VWDSIPNVRDEFDDIDRLVAANLARVQAAFREHRVGPHHFAGSTGYGHGDLGRDTLDAVMATIFGAEAAACRIQFVSGTHAIAAGLFACLRPGDELLAVAGSPYDTLEEVIGTRGTPQSGSLMDFGVSYRTLDLKEDGTVDYEGLAGALRPETKVALVQRSCGYALRPTLSIDDIKRIVNVIKAKSPDTLVLVDNCYGEMTAECEPTAVGADLCMGSFIKNPGATIVTGGGYVAGRRDLVDRAVARMSAPGVGMDAGSVPGETLRLMFQGLYMCPATVGEALKSGRLIAEVFSSRGYTVVPDKGDTGAHSFITAIKMQTPEAMLNFCKIVQRNSPIGSYVRPELFREPMGKCARRVARTDGQLNHSFQDSCHCAPARWIDGVAVTTRCLTLRLALLPSVVLRPIVDLRFITCRKISPGSSFLTETVRLLPHL
jgi:cystathionine beta-lyase family protein involved in aluminum resistance